MDYILLVLSTILLGAITRAAGGGFIGSTVEKLKAGNWFKRNILAGFLGRLPELIFAAAFGEVAYITSGSVWCGLASWVWSFIFMEAGHGNAAHMGISKNDMPPRRQGLDTVALPTCRAIEWISRRIKRPVVIENRSTTYCWIFMAWKGFLIGLPLGWFALLMAFIWPTSYAIAMQDQDRLPYELRSWAVGEWISGILSRIVILCAIAHHQLLAERLEGAAATLLPFFIG